MKAKKTVTLDLTGCKSLGELHLRIKKAFDFPDFYGQNWDAFWDLLRTECDADRIELCGKDTVSAELADCVKKICTILQKFKEHCAKYGDEIEIVVHP